jgi:1-acyl-sn-glycerol-3-phosphate acyltransferase
LLYSVLKPIIRFSLHSYFERINVLGKENLPLNGPAIFVSNHPSAVIDPLVIAAIMKKDVYFLAGAEWFGKGLKSAIFKNQLNMIPVHRPWLSNDKTVSNNEMFKDCYTILEKGNSIVLFPEASSATVSKIRELKTGAIRIKTGFEDRMGHTVNVPIIPIGLNYSNAHKFRSELLINIGKAIPFETENGSLTSEVIRSMTRQMEEALKKTIIHIDNDENVTLVQQVTELLSSSPEISRSSTSMASESNFHLAKKVVSALNYFEMKKPEEAKKISARIDQYFKRVMNTGIAEKDLLDSKGSSSSPLNIFLMLIGFPFYIISAMIYFPPFYLTRYLIRKKHQTNQSDERKAAPFNSAFTGSMILLIGMGVFISYALIMTVLTGIITNNWILGIGIFFLFFPFFQFNLLYKQLYLDLLKKVEVRILESRNAQNIISLKKERKEIIAILMEYNNQYDLSE